VRHQVEVNVPRSGRGRRFVGRLQGEEVPTALMLHPGIPVLGMAALPVDRVALAENALVPVADVRFGKVAKNPLIFSTFFVHVWGFMTFHDPVGQMLGQR
jgi:hypothetical protein